MILIANGVALCHSAVTEARELRKDEPHPVGPLTAVDQFLGDLAIDVGLSVHEADEIGLGHGGCCDSSARL
jgi:hypothetical protein